MKIPIKKITSPPNSPKIATDSFKMTSPPKTSATNFNFSKWKEKMKMEVGGNFRERAERAGVPPELVKEFKYWLIENESR